MGSAINADTPAWIKPYDLKDKIAIVTGAGSGINLATAKLLLQAGTSVVLADLRLRPEAEELITQYPHPPSSDKADKKPSAVFIKTDVVDWAQLRTLFDGAVQTFGRVDIVVNGAGLFEPPSSSFWFNPDHSTLAVDSADCNPGVYQTFAVNTMSPIRLAQIAVDYWSQNKIEGNLLWLASAGGYVHLMQCPFYFASKAAIVSFVKSTGRLRSALGIRNSAVTPGMAHTPMTQQEYCKNRLLPTDVGLTPQIIAEQMIQVLTAPEYGDGNIVELTPVGTCAADTQCQVREVPLELLYPPVVGNHLGEEDTVFVEQLKAKGMREWMN
ncbi:hypothetical protein Vi05172_g9212 [Venturia inaequalis]|nr:hypothetical protein Vi05172_g9212 [Venturia inaequalis]